jgi:DNA-binding GntR family transcriptional regulator
MRATSNRKLAEALGVSETAVRKALAAGRIARDPDGSFDVAKVKRQ